MYAFLMFLKVYSDNTINRYSYECIPKAYIRFYHVFEVVKHKVHSFWSCIEIHKF